MKKIISLIFAILLLALSLSAQTEEQRLVEFDTFGNLPLGDLSARMDSFQNEVKNRENALALIRIYSDKKSLSFPYIRKAFYEAYFSNYNFIKKGNLIIQICNVGQPEVKNQFFLVSKEVKIDKCEEKFSIPRKTSLVASEIFRPTGNVDDYLGTEGVDKAVTEASYDFTAELLKKSPGSKLYIIGYAGRFFEPAEGEVEEEVVSEIDSLRVNDKSLKLMKNAIIKRDISASRIIITRGGYRNYSRESDVWFVPKGGETPKPKPDYFPKMQK